MNRRFLFICGMAAPLLFVFMTILGGAIRPGYSHLSETVSELFSPGSPNKPLLDTLHTTFAFLLILFGIGILQFIRRSGRATGAGKIGAVLYIAMGCVSVLTAAVFHQDPWGTPPTFLGQMHIILTGVVGLLSVFSILFIGFWFNRAKIFPGFGTYSYITVGTAVLAAGFFMANQGSPIMGLTERIAALIGFLWTFTLARWMSSRKI